MSVAGGLAKAVGAAGFRIGPAGRFPQL